MLPRWNCSIWQKEVNLTLWACAGVSKDAVHSVTILEVLRTHACILKMHVKL